jgi:predicted nucleotidyltransferase
MRIDKNEILIINTLAISCFGVGTKVFLFGSRTDDERKGGDIDLFITNDDPEKLTLQAKIIFLAELKRLIGDQKIDVVLDTVKTRHKKVFYHSITAQAIGL